MRTKWTMTAAILLGVAAVSASLVGCNKEDLQDELTTNTVGDDGMAKAVGGRFINGLNGWDSFDVSNVAAELGEFEANIDNTGRSTIRTENATSLRVGDGGNYPVGICDGEVPNQGGFRMTKGANAATCGATYYLTPRKSGNNGQCLKLRIKRGVLPALPAGQSWFTCSGAGGTWTAHALASTYMCWSVQAAAPTPLCE